MVRRFVRRIGAYAAFLTAPAVATAQVGTITGSVTDSATGRPIAGATARALAAGRAPVVALSSDIGAFRLSPVDPGNWTLEVTALGYRMARVAGVSVTAGATVRVNVVMSAVATVLNPVVTTASRGVVAEKVLDAPAAISVVVAEQISTRPATLPTDFLRTLPGVSVSSAGIGHSNTVSRGFNNAFSSSLLGLQDYRFSGLPSLRANLPLINTGTMEDIDRIEVLNGPAAALFGPNAANGVLHVITKSAFRSQGTTLTLDAGERSIVRLAGRSARVFGSRNDWGAKVSGEYFSGTDWPDKDPNLPATFPVTAPPGRVGTPVRRGTQVRRYNGEFRLDYQRPQGDLENTFTAGYTHILNSNEVTTAFGPTQGRHWSYTSVQDRLRYKKFFAQIFYNGSNSGSRSATDLDGSYYLATGIPIVDQSTVTAVQAQQGFTLFGARMIAGVDYIATEPRSKGTVYGRYETTPDFGSTNLQERGAYLHGTFAVRPSLKVVAAVRGDQTNALEGSQFSPSVALVHSPSATQSWRATFSRAFNSPIAYQYFLDQVANPNAAPGMPLRVIGNPAKQGWQFNRSCASSIHAGLCMHSPWVAQGGGATVAASAASAFPGFVAALPQVIAVLPTLSAAAKAQLTALLAQLNPILSGLRPTDAQVGSYLLRNGVEPGASVKDIDALRASFNNTWELGYKGIIRDRVMLAANLWYQVRGDVGQIAGQANPLVMFDPNSLGAYLATSITQGLVASGQTQAQAQATATAAVSALVPLMAALPQGSVAFSSALHNDPSIVVTYVNGNGRVHVHGFDLGMDVHASDDVVVTTTYAYQNKITFPRIGGAANPLMSNTPKHRASVSARYSPEAGWGTDGTVRYADAFPVNSGYYNSLTPNAFNASFATYAPVPATTQVDAGVWYRFRPSRVTVAVHGTNLLNHKVPTFAGTPAIGRLLLTRLRYEF